jgi:hypothetical protein
LRQLESYHHAWLSIHPTRTEEWLRKQLAEGFDVHHLDGHHDNNDPDNLVLIEHVDHMRLHGIRSGARLSYMVRSGPRKRTLSLGETAYKHRASGKSWREIGQEIGSISGAMSSAKVYAKQLSLRWPPIAG